MNTDFFQQLFAEFNSPESYTIIAIMLVAFIFGLLLGYLLRGGALARLRRKLEEAQGPRVELEKQAEEWAAQLAAANQENHYLETEIQGLREELGRSKEELSRHEAERNRLYREINAINANLEKMEASNKSYLSTIEDLNHQISAFKAQVGSLSAKGATLAAAPDDTTERRLDWVERKLLQLESENIALKEEVDQLKEQRGDEVRHSYVPDQDDDLTLIKGIGPLLAGKLQAMGVDSFEKISRLDAASIAEISRQLQFFEGRIERDDWVGQARRLHELKLRDPEAFQRLTSPPLDRSDLKIIEGVGPKIEQILKKNGIYTWNDLADSDVTDIRAALQAAGDKFRIHDPSTWPIQARLAVNGDWSLLREYQEQLKGGRENPPTA
jgi:predicted flap endonuclease-1-like 5' DNA nuclease